MSTNEPDVYVTEEDAEKPIAGYKALVDSGVMTQDGIDTRTGLPFDFTKNGHA